MSVDDTIVSNLTEFITRLMENVKERPEVLIGTPEEFNDPILQEALSIIGYKCYIIVIYPPISKKRNNPLMMQKKRIAKRLRKKGLPMTWIAKTVGVSYRTIWSWCHEKD